MPFIPDKKSRFIPDAPSVKAGEIGKAFVRGAINPSERGVMDGAIMAATGGNDPIYRGVKAAAENAYGQAKGVLKAQIPDDFKEKIGQGVVGALSPAAQPFIPKKASVAIGNVGSDVGIDVASSFATEGVGPLAKGASKLAAGVGKAAEEAGGRALNFYIKPRAAGYRFGANPGRAVAKHIGPQMSREALLENIVSKKDELLDQLQSAAENQKNSFVDATPIFEEIQSSVTKLKDFPETYAGQIESHRSLARDLLKIISQHGVMKGGRVYVNPVDAIKIKRGIGQMPSWATMDPKLGSLTKTSRKVYGRFDKEIDKVVPEAAELNQDVSDLMGAQKGIELGAQRENNKHPFGLIDLAVGGLTSASGGGVPGLLAGAVGSKFVRSAPFNTAVGASAGAVGRAARRTSSALNRIEGPQILRQINRLFEAPERGLSVVDPPSPDIARLTRNRRFAASRMLPDQGSGPTIPAEGRSPTIEMPQVLESDKARMAQEFGVPTFGDGPRDVVKEFPKVPRGFLSKGILAILKRRNNR